MQSRDGQFDSSVTRP
nr:unnamed protein product [Callosobruchus chinensis]CAH7769586.1 unnamed protein product [Callosobruchus chinensis]